MDKELALQAEIFALDIAGDRMAPDTDRLLAYTLLRLLQGEVEE